jgi:hypothetical protein
MDKTRSDDNLRRFRLVAGRLKGPCLKGSRGRCRAGGKVAAPPAPIAGAICVRSWMSSAGASSSAIREGSLPTEPQPPSRHRAMRARGHQMLINKGHGGGAPEDGDARSPAGSGTCRPRGLSGMRYRICREPLHAGGFADRRAQGRPSAAKRATRERSPRSGRTARLGACVGRPELGAERDIATRSIHLASTASSIIWAAHRLPHAGRVVMTTEHPGSESGLGRIAS